MIDAGSLLPPALHQEVAAEKKEEEDPLKHSCRPLGGIWKDLRKLGRRYRSDITDAFNMQVLVSILFMYIALLGPAIAFGGLMEEITLNVIGETETLLATGLAGVVYGLFSVQPISILAFTGPVLLFETIIYRVSANVQIYKFDNLCLILGTIAKRFTLPLLLIKLIVQVKDFCPVLGFCRISYLTVAVVIKEKTAWLLYAGRVLILYQSLSHTLAHTHTLLFSLTLPLRMP